MRKSVSTSADWERRITNIVVTAVILYIGTVAKNADTRMEVLSNSFKSTLASIEKIIQKGDMVDTRSLTNKLRIDEHEKRISKLEK